MPFSFGGQTQIRWMTQGTTEQIYRYGDNVEGIVSGLFACDLDDPVWFETPASLVVDTVCFKYHSSLLSK